jgi:hypothetical protein
MHHPKKVGLDPAHPVEAEVRSVELSMLDCVAADRRLVSLLKKVKKKVQSIERLLPPWWRGIVVIASVSRVRIPPGCEVFMSL